MATYVLQSTTLAIQNSTLLSKSLRIAGIVSECAWWLLEGGFGLGFGLDLVNLGLVLKDPLDYLPL